MSIKFDGQTHEIILIKYLGNFYALGAFCIYDNSTKLSEGGIIFGDKLMAPRHGIAYNITNGSIEDGPCLDSLPVYKTWQDEKTGEVKILFPKNPPKKVRPFLYNRDFNDHRKCVIIGGGEAAMSAAITLRNLEFTGEVTVLSPMDEYPINRDKLLS